MRQIHHLTKCLTKCRMDWSVIHEWIVAVSDEYGVNPTVFGIIYFGAIPFFAMSVVWLSRNKRRGQSIYLPVLSAAFFSFSAYLYLIIAGRNIPMWVYGVIATLALYGTWTLVRKFRTPATTSNV